jgi:cell filamentation protein
VLANKLHITDPEEMEEAELVLLEQLYESVLIDHLPPGPITVVDLISWHRLWLGNVYDWAGDLRSLNTSKGGFLFAAAGQIQRLLAEFERDCLTRYTPASADDHEIFVQGIAITHAELILIHPFVEGNGRLARLLADVMAVQAGYEPLDYSAWDADRERYFAAVRDAMARNYDEMQRLVSLALSSGG